MIELKAVDYSSDHPAAADLAAENVAAAFGYMSWSRPTLEEVVAYRKEGIRVGWIFESTITRCFEGYPAGFYDGTWARHNRDLALTDDPQVVCLGDTPNITGHETETAEYARGFMTGFGRKPDLGYGCEAAWQACKDYVLGWWGVEVWTGGGFGKRPGVGTVGTGNDEHLAANVAVWRALGAAMVQAYGPGPVIGTDLNVVLDPTLVGVGHLIPIPEDDTMYWLKCDETQQWAVVSEFRVAAYPLGEVQNPPPVFIICTKAELDAEIQARQDLAKVAAGKVEGAQAAPADLSGVKAGLEQATAGLTAATTALDQVG